MMTPMPPIGLTAPMRAISSCSTRASAAVSPPPPYCLGQVGTPQPLSPMRLRQISTSPSALAPPPSQALSGLGSFRSQAG